MIHLITTHLTDDLRMYLSLYTVYDLLSVHLRKVLTTRSRAAASISIKQSCLSAVRQSQCPVTRHTSLGSESQLETNMCFCTVSAVSVYICCCVSVEWRERVLQTKCHSKPEANKSVMSAASLALRRRMLIGKTICFRRKLKIQRVTQRYLNPVTQN